jgi:L-malate glycosyltransferase
MTSALAEFLDGDTSAAPAGQGGTPLCTLVRGLLERGRRVTVCALDPGVRERVTFRGELLTLRYGLYRARHHMRDGMLLERSTIRDLIRESRPDVVNAHWAYEYALGAQASGYPTLVTVHDWAPAILRHAPTPYWFARQFMYLRAVRRADALVAVSPYLGHKLERIARRPVTVIPDAVEPSWFTQEPRRARADAPLLVSVNSGFTSLKNVGTLLEAFPLVRKAIPASRLTLVGPGFEPRGAARQWAAERGLSAGVEFAGVLAPADVRALLGACDVLVHPSREESFGMPVVEAMARRTPVVGGQASGSVPWLLDGGRAGALADVRSPLSMAATIVALLGEPGLWRRSSEAGYRRARAYFSIGPVVEQYLDAYERLLAGEGR